MQASMQRSAAFSGTNCMPSAPKRQTGRKAAITCSSHKEKSTAREGNLFLMNSIGAVMAAQLAFSPAAFADKTPIKAGVDVAAEAQQAIPEAKRNPIEREAKSSERESGLKDAIGTVKDRLDITRDADSSKTQDIFFNPEGKQSGVSYLFGGGHAPQLDVSEKLNQELSKGAKEAGNAAKELGEKDPLAPAQGAAGDATSAAKEAGDKVSGLFKGTSYSGYSSGALQVNVSEKLNQEVSGAAKDAAQTVKNAGDSNPAEAAKGAAGDAGDAAKKAGDKVSGFFKGVSYPGFSDLQVNVSEKLNQEVSGAAKDAAQTVKNAGDSNPADAAKGAAGDASDAAKKAGDKVSGFFKGVSYAGNSGLQVNVSEKLNQEVSGAAKDAAQTVKNAGDSNPADAAKGAAGDAGDAAKKAGDKVSGFFKGVSSPVDGAPLVLVGNNPVQQAKDAVQQGGGPLDALKGKIDGAAITKNSPQKQLEKAGDKVEELKSQRNVSQSGRYVQRPAANTFGGRMFMLADASVGISQTRENADPLASGKGDPTRGGDLKDSKSNASAAQNKPSDVGLTADQNNSAKPRSGSKGLLRPDSETPEQAAQGNLAAARASNGGPIEGLKKAAGL